MTEVVITKTTVVTSANTAAGGVVTNPPSREVVVVAGIPGPPGQPAVGALLASNKLAELATSSETQEAAQKNLGLGLTDPLAYYILAKA